MNFNVLFGTNVFFYICLDIYNVNDQLNYYYHATGIYICIIYNSVFKGRTIELTMSK